MSGHGLLDDMSNNYDTDRFEFGTDVDDVAKAVMSRRLERPALDDSARNQLAGLAHEPCEHHCADCGRCDWEPVSPFDTVTVPGRVVDGEWLCEDCDEGSDQ